MADPFSHGVLSFPRKDNGQGVVTQTWKRHAHAGQIAPVSTTNNDQRGKRKMKETGVGVGKKWRNETNSKYMKKNEKGSGMARVGCQPCRQQ